MPEHEKLCPSFVWQSIAFAAVAMAPLNPEEGRLGLQAIDLVCPLVCRELSLILLACRSGWKQDCLFPTSCLLQSYRVTEPRGYQSIVLPKCAIDSPLQDWGALW